MVMKRFLIGLSKLVLGLFLALVIMSVAGLAAARYFLTRLSDLPDRPVFDDTPAETLPADTNASTPATAEAEAVPDAATDTAETSEEEAQEEPLPEGAYRAAVTYPTGLIMRSGPGVEYGQTWWRRLQR
jgi:hypothetical protein